MSSVLYSYNCQLVGGERDASVQTSSSGYLDLVQRLEFGVDHLQKNAVYQIE